MTAEAALIAAVLVITGVLVNQNPVLATTEVTLPAIAPMPATPVPDGSQLVADHLMVMGDMGDVSLHGMLAPGTTGANTLTFSLNDEHGMPVETVANPTIALSLPSHDLGPLEFEATATDEPGTYRAPISIPLAGEWEITISARVSRFEEPSTTLTVTIP